jgi:two-component system cell cycle sensor histidine kinase/response regulator CckA
MPSRQAPGGGLSSLVADVQLRRLLECFPGVVWMTDRKLRAVAVVGADLDVLGLRESELLGRTVSEVLGGSSTTQPSLSAHRRALKGERGSYRIEFEGRVRRGQVEPLRDTGGAIVGVVGMSVDATELTTADRALAELAAIVASTGDAVIGKSLDGTVTSWNAGAERMYGYTAAEMVGRPISVLIPPERDDELPDALERVAAGDTVERLETVRMRKDGSRLDVSLTISPIRETGGAVIGASTIARDVSALVRTEEALRRSEENYRLLFELHPSPMWVFDSETLRFLAANDAAIATYGYSLEEFLSMTIEQIRPDEEIQALSEHLENPDRGPLGAGIWHHRTKDGTTIEVQVISNAIGFEDRRARLVLAQDVTERRRLEEQLRQSHKMESVGSLAGGIAHDFNNILTVIRGVSGLVLEETSDERVQERVRQIDRAAEHAAKLTHQLLAFSRQQVLQPEPSDLNAVVEQTLELVLRMIGENIELELRLEPGLATIVVDRSQLQQVILNLSVNARDAMPDGGTLAIRTANVELNKAYAADHLDVTPGSYVLLEITDSGSGMDEQTRSRIFDPFFTTKTEGTGLGLATVYGIIAQSGGHIWLYSEPGMGTTFKIYLPGVDATVPASPRVAPVSSASLEGSETILLVEDAEMLRPLVAEVLRSYGYTVLTAADGVEAIELVERQPGPIDLLLTDVVMPNMNGRELAETLVAGDPRLKVLFTSGYPSDTIIRHGIAEAQVAFIQKPYLADELAGKIRATLDSPAETARPGA